MPRPEPIGAAKRHDGRGARVDQASRHNQVVVEIGQRGEALFDQYPRGFERGLRCRERASSVADHFELHPMR